MKESTAVGMKSRLDHHYRWVEPDSDITVCLELEAVERLQRDVLSGLDSGARSGNEVGGILLGRTEVEDGRNFVIVEDFEPIVCEHRHGPFYVLTAGERARFDATVEHNGARHGRFVVGYYRSHNREGLFLSADDVQLIHRHFRAPGSVLLLIKTLPNRGCTAGFFFWRDGFLQTEFTDSEAPLIPIVDPSAEAAVPAAPTVPIPVAVEEPADRREPQRRLIRGMVVTGVAAAAVLGTFVYRETRTLGPLHGRDGREIPLAFGKVALPAPVAVTSPAAAAPKAIVAVVPTPPKTVPPKTATPRRDEAKSPIRAAPAEADPRTPAPSKALSDAAPGNSAPQVAATVPVAVPPPVEKAAAAVIEPSRTEAVPPAPPTALPPAPVPTATPQAASTPAARTWMGPQVVHQVAPAVPRGVGPRITTDVQVDVAVSIDATGKVTGARVASMKGAAAGLLTIEALKAAQLFRFQPAQENGRPVASSMVLTFRFAGTAK